jgi:hypothetical protein
LPSLGETDRRGGAVSLESLDSSQLFDVRPGLLEPLLRVVDEA